MCLQPRASLQILLLLSGDVERCPGPDAQTFNTEMENVSRCKIMKLLHLNVRGLWSNFAYFYEILSSHKFIDIFGFTETHIMDELGELFDLPGYTYLNKPRTSGKGVALVFMFPTG